MNTVKRWIQRPEGSTWGDWGEDDQLGRLNLIGPEQVRRGVAEVQEGRTFCLSLPLHLPGGNVLSPVRYPPVLKPVIRNDQPYYNYDWSLLDARLTDLAADDVVLLHTQYSTQWDSLAHRGSKFDVNGDGVPESIYYNGFPADEALRMSEDGSVAAAKLGIEHMAQHGVQGRGVCVDLHRHCGDERIEIGYRDLMRILDLGHIQVECGDILTRFFQQQRRMGKK